jgi:hypothetical protein
MHTDNMGTMATVRLYITTACWCCAQGVMDSANVKLFADYFMTNTAIRSLISNCFIINFVLFLSLYLISELMSPIQFTGAFAIVMGGLFGAMWVIPMYVVTQTLGLTWYEQLFDEVQKERCARRKRPPPPPRPFSFTGISEVLLKSLVTLIFGVLAGVVALIPMRLGGLLPFDVAVGPMLSLAMGCWLNSVYCFDYRFNQVGTVHSRTGKLVPVSLSSSLNYFEQKWAYFLGFSMWHIAVRTAMEYAGVFLFGRLAICSALFAVNVVLSVDAKPTLPGDNVLPQLPIFLPFYRLVGDALSRNHKANKVVVPESAPEKPAAVEGVPENNAKPKVAPEPPLRAPTPPPKVNTPRAPEPEAKGPKSPSEGPSDATVSRFIDDEYVLVD